MEEFLCHGEKEGNKVGGGDLSESVNPLSSIAGTFFWGLTLINSSLVLVSPEKTKHHTRTVR